MKPSPDTATAGVKSIHLDEQIDELKSGQWWLWSCTVEMMDGTTRTGTIEGTEHSQARETLELDDNDPTPYCAVCNAGSITTCTCPPPAPQEFADWWFNTGSWLQPIEGQDMEEHAHRVAYLAWNAARGTTQND